MSSQLPSNWITQNCPAPDAHHNKALDLACGKGRHSFWLADQGWQVTAIDRDLSKTDTEANPSINWIEADLETGTWPLGNQKFDLIIVVNYLHRPLFPYLRHAVRASGILIYETFMQGNEAFGRPQSPAFLLKPNELQTHVPRWNILAFRQGQVTFDGTDQVKAVKQFMVVQKPD